LIDWQKVEKKTQETTSESEFVPSSFYALLKLCFRPKGENKAIPLVPAIHHRARSGDGLAASQLAARCLRGSGYPPLVEKLPVAATVARRTAAALVFPISPRDFSLLEQITINQPKSQNT
jgi:CRISPR-associated protein Csx17